jgi:hypothetical protein
MPTVVFVLLQLPCSLVSWMVTVGMYHIHRQYYQLELFFIVSAFHVQWVVFPDASYRFFEFYAHYFYVRSNEFYIPCLFYEL